MTQRRHSGRRRQTGRFWRLGRRWRLWREKKDKLTALLAQEQALTRELSAAKKEVDSARAALEAFIRQAEQVRGSLKEAREQEQALVRQAEPQTDFAEVFCQAGEQMKILEEENRKAEKAYRTLFGAFQSNERTEKLLAQYREEYEALQKEYTTVRHLSQTAGGTLPGTAKIDFESYIQRRYFERVIYRANQRLLKMSDGQFLLRCREMGALGSQGKVGLDLDVYSLVTESVRDVKTLSGGESFMAALSMALGLADVIGDSAGAIRLDALFIDEGFGSLDENARGQAIRVLYELAGENRLIGIISHVTELKEQIEPKLVVKKTKTGSHVSWLR